MIRFPQSPWFVAGLACITGLILRIYFVIATPIAGPSLPHKLSSFNDEIAHGKYAQFILVHGSLPKCAEPITAPGALERGQFENYQPPLYYALVAALCYLLNRHSITDIIFAGRWLNVFLFLLLLWVGWRLCRNISLSLSSRIAGMIFLFLSGVLVRFTSTAGNDVLFWLFSGLALWLLHKMSRDYGRPLDGILLAAIFACGLYTKFSMLLWLPLLFVGNLRRQWRTMLIVFSAIIISTIPIWHRNLTVFGSLLPLNAGFGEPAWRLPGFESLLYFFRSAIFPWSEFWHGIPGLIILLIPVAALLFLGLRAEPRQGSEVPRLYRHAFGIALLAFVFLNFRYDQAEARYIFAAWPAIMFFVSRKTPTISQLSLLCIALLCPYALFFL